ncbi:glycosyltransferase family 4 protein [Desulfomicrobium salsuginis]
MSHRPKVLLCCEHYPPSVGGVQEVMRQIAERLAADGVDVTVASSPHPDRAQDTLRNGVRVVSFPIKGNRAKGIAGPVEEYRSFLLQGNFDALLIKAAQQWTFDAAIEVLPRLSCRKLFIPCGFSGLHDPFYADYYRIMPDWLRCFDGLIFYATDYQDIAFARHHKVSHLHLVPNGVDEREFIDPSDQGIRHKLGINIGDDLLLSVGSRLAAKGHWEVIRAFRHARLIRPATLVINANSPGSRFVELFKRQVKHLSTGRWPLVWLAWLQGLQTSSKRVVIVDLPRSDVVNLYKSANLFVLASHVEYSPLVLFEACAAGTPFLASSVGNSNEIALWTGGGRVIPRHKETSAVLSIPVLGNEMGDMLSNPEKIRAMGQTARTLIWSKGFTWDQIVPEYRRLMLG